MCKSLVPHKWADVIHAWADGATVQLYRDSDGKWIDMHSPLWNSKNPYRIKPTSITKEQAREAVQRSWKTRPSSDYRIIWDFLHQDD